MERGGGDKDQVGLSYKNRQYELTTKHHILSWMSGIGKMQSNHHLAPQLYIFFVSCRFLILRSLSSVGVNPVTRASNRWAEVHVWCALGKLTPATLKSKRQSYSCMKYEERGIEKNSPKSVPPPPFGKFRRAKVTFRHFLRPKIGF